MRLDRRDVVAGATVAAVLLPQSLAYAELAGVPAQRGLLAAAVAATVGALAGSSPQLQTGPTALASLLTLGVLAERAPVGSDRYVAMAAVLAVFVGLVRLAAGRASLGIVSFLLSRPVIAGLSVGAGALIVASQVAAMVGTEASGDPLGEVVTVLGDPGLAEPAALLVAGVALLVMVATRRLPQVPSALLALVAGGLAAGALPDVAAIELTGPVVGIAVGALELGDLVALVVPAVVIAFVGFAEVTAIARATATRGREAWSPDRELTGQGWACLGAGLAGGFPVSGSFSRSALNRMAGASSRWAGVTTGVIVLAILPVVGWLPAIPRPALAAIVAVAGASLIDVRQLVELYGLSRLQFSVAAVTTAATILASPRVDIAVLVGVAAAAAVHLFREEFVHVLVERDGRVLRAGLHGVMFYLSVPRVEQALGDAVAAAGPELEEVQLDLGGLGRVDVSAALALTDLVGELHEAGLTVRVTAVPPPAVRILSRTLAHRVDLPEAPGTTDVPA